MSEQEEAMRRIMERRAKEDAEREQEIAQSRSVPCPTCKVGVGEPCDWGATNNGASHKPRIDKAKKAATHPIFRGKG